MIGWIGSLALALCGLPQALKCIKDRNANGLDTTFLVLWTVGEALTLAAVSHDASSLIYLLFNYASNLLFLSIIWYYKLVPSNRP